MIVNFKNVLILFSAVILGVSCTTSDQLLFKLIPSRDTGIVFKNTIIETDNFNILTEEYIFNGGGVGVADFNNDGRKDLFFTGNQVNNQLYLNDGNFKFSDVSEMSKVEGKNSWCTGVTI